MIKHLYSLLGTSLCKGCFKRPRHIRQRLICPAQSFKNSKHTGWRTSSKDSSSCRPTTAPHNGHKGGLRVRGPAAVGQHRAPGTLPVVPARLRAPPEERVGAQGQGPGRLPPRQLQGPLPHPGVAQLLAGLAPQAPGPLAEGPLHRGRAAAGQAPGRRRQVQDPQEVPAAQDHLGRRGDQLLLQGEVAQHPARVVRPQPVPVPAGEAGAGRGHGTDHHAGQQLVQEPAAEGPGGRGQRQGPRRQAQDAHLLLGQAGRRRQPGQRPRRPPAALDRPPAPPPPAALSRLGHGAPRQLRLLQRPLLLGRRPRQAQPRRPAAPRARRGARRPLGGRPRRGRGGRLPPGALRRPVGGAPGRAGAPPAGRHRRTGAGGLPPRAVMTGGPRGRRARLRPGEPRVRGRDHGGAAAVPDLAGEPADEPGDVQVPGPGLVRVELEFVRTRPGAKKKKKTGSQSERPQTRSLCIEPSPTKKDASHAASSWVNVAISCPPREVAGRI